MPDLNVISDYPYSRTAIASLAERLGSREGAISALVEDLKTGFVRAVGIEDTSLSSRVSRNGPKTTSLQFVPQRFWQIATAEDVASWNWSRGHFSLKAPYVELEGAGSAWTDVRFEAATLPEVGKPRSSKGRKRTPLWDDWVAALAILSTNGEITGQLTETQVLTKIADQMAEWEVEEMPRTTTRKAAAAILMRLRAADI